MRLAPGSEAMLPVPTTKMANVGVVLAAIETVTVAAGGDRHAPVDGLVWQIVSVTGNVTGPVSADTVIVPVAPTLTVATANAAAPFALGSASEPSPEAVAPSATMSGAAVADAVSSSVLTPDSDGAGSSPSHVNLS